MTEFKDIAAQDTLRLTPEMLAATQQAAPKQKKAPPPFSIRFTFEERARLEQAAAGMPLGAYIRQKLFDGELTPRRTRGRAPVKDHAELARVLGALGASRLSSNLTKTLIGQRMTGLIQRYIGDAETALKTKEDALALKKAQIKERHCAARQKLIERQAERWAEETRQRASRFRSGFGGIWDWLTGKSKKIARENEREAYKAVKRDDQEREDQRQAQFKERRALQNELSELKDSHQKEVAALREDIASYLDLRGDHGQHHDGDDRQHVARSKQDRGDHDRQRGGDFEI